jgi:hypothetical protein
VSDGKTGSKKEITTKTSQKVETQSSKTITQKESVTKVTQV